MSTRILVVDDNVSFVDSLRDVLEDEGYEVITANDGQEALEISQRERFDLVLMDVKMPRLNGVECFLRMKSSLPDIKVILFTAYQLDELIFQAREKGVWAVLNKPLDIDRFLRIVEDAKKTTPGNLVLLLDDDLSFAESLRDAMADVGYRVSVASRGDEALSMVEDAHFDILLLDMRLPEVTGLEVYRRIKKLRPDILTIILSGYQEEMMDSIQQAIREKACTFLPKPVDVGKLLHVLEDLNKKTAQVS